MVQQIPIVPPLSTLISVAQRRRGKGREKNSPSHTHNKLPTGFLVKRIWQFLFLAPKQQELLENCANKESRQKYGSPPPMNRHNRCCFVGSSFFRVFGGFLFLLLWAGSGREAYLIECQFSPFLFSLLLSFHSFNIFFLRRRRGGRVQEFNKVNIHFLFLFFFFPLACFYGGKEGINLKAKERNGNINEKNYPLSEFGSRNRCVNYFCGTCTYYTGYPFFADTLCPFFLPWQIKNGALSYFSSSYPEIRLCCCCSKRKSLTLRMSHSPKKKISLIEKHRFGFFISVQHYEAIGFFFRLV